MNTFITPMQSIFNFLKSRKKRNQTLLIFLGIATICAIQSWTTTNNSPLDETTNLAVLEPVGAWNKLLPSQRATLQAGGTVNGFNLGFCDAMMNPITANITSSPPPGDPSLPSVNARQPRRWGNTSFYLAMENAGAGGVQYCFDFSTPVSVSLDSREHAYFADFENIGISVNNGGVPVNLTATFNGLPTSPAFSMTGNGTPNVVLSAGPTEGGGLWWEVNTGGQLVSQVCIEYYSTGGTQVVEPFRLLIDAVKCVADDPVICQSSEWISRWNKLNVTQRTDLLEGTSVYGFNTGFCDETGDAITFIEIEANAAPNSGNFQKNAKEPRPYGEYSFDNGRDYVGMGGSQYCFTLDEARPIRLSSEEHRFFSGTEVVNLTAYLGADPVLLNGMYFNGNGSGPVSGGPNGLSINGFQYGADNWWVIGSEDRPVSQVCVEYYVNGGVPVGREPFALGICATRCIYDDPYACSLQGGGPCTAFPIVDIEKTVTPLNGFGLNPCDNPGGNVTYPSFEVLIKMRNHAGSIKQLFLEEDLLAYFGAAYVDTISAPQIVFSNSSGDPEIDPYFDGRNYTNIFIPGSGFLSAGQEIWVSFSVYLDPNAPGAESNLINSVYGGGTAGGSYIYQDLSGGLGSGDGIPTAFTNLPAGYTAVNAQNLTLEATIPNSMNGIDNWLATNGGAQFSVPGCGNVTWTNDYDPANWVVGCGQLTGSIEVTFTATDGCGHTFSTCATFTLEDTIGPACTKPEDLTLNCGDPNALDILQGWLDYDGTFTDLSTPVTFTNDFSGFDSLGCDGDSILVTWTATDNCGNESYFDAYLSVTDTIAPVISGVPGDLVLDKCDSIPSSAMVSVVDGCDTIPTLVFEEIFTGDSCHYTLTRTWTATDNCGNVSQQAQTINVSDDNPPVFSNVPADITVECPDVPPIVDPDVEDCSPFTLNYTEVQIGDDCPMPNQIIRTWIATDNCGNVDSVQQVVTLTSPINNGMITFTPGTLDTLIGTCEDNLQFDTVSVETSCPSDGLTVAFSDVVENNGDCSQPFTVERTWVAIDSCGNVASISQTLIVGPDTIPPVFDTTNLVDIMVDCGDTLSLPDVADNCGDIELSYIDTAVVGSCDTGFTFVRVWTAADLCGNTATFSQNVVTSPDTIAPVFTYVPDDQIFDCEDTIVFENPIAYDLCGNVTLTWQDSIIGSGDCEEVDSVLMGYAIIRTWTATDDCGNAASAITNGIVIPDFNSGNLIAFSHVPEDKMVACGDDLEFGLAICHSACGEVTVTFEDFYSEDCDNGTVITRVWTAEDECENTIQATQIITIMPDVIPPVFEFVPTNGTFNCELATPQFGIPVVKDNCADGTSIDISYNDVWENAGGCDGFTVTRTWTAIDPCGNESTASQVMTLVDDVAPVFEDIPVDMQISCGEPVIFGQAIAIDACSNAQLTFTDSSVDLCGGGYALTRTWTAKDACGNVSTASQTVTVVDDVAPVFDFVPANKTYGCGEMIDFGLAEASDACSGASLSYEDETALTCGGGYIITRTWIAIDDCGNMAQTVQKVTVADEVPPVFVTQLDDIYINCGDPIEFDDVEAMDDCSGFAISQNDVEEILNCEKVVTRTWTATDDCGNATSISQAVHVVDNEAPVFNGMTDYIEMTQAEFAAWTPPVGDADDCTSVSIEVNTVTESTCDYITHLYNYTASDPCGNSATHTLEVLLTDAAFGMTTELPQEIDCGELYMLTVQPENGLPPYTYMWQVISGDGWEITAMPGQPVAEILAGDGPAQIGVGVVDGNGCSALEVYDLDCDGFVNTGEKDQFGTLVLSPNPVNNLLAIQLNSILTGDATVSIINVMGERVHMDSQLINLGINQFNIDASQMTNGTYILVIQMDDRVVVEKFVKVD